MFTSLIVAITGGFNAFSLIAQALQTAAAAYVKHVDLLWNQNLQASAQPLEQGKATTDAQKATGAKGIADAIASIPSS